MKKLFEMLMWGLGILLVGLVIVMIADWLAKLTVEVF